MSFGPWLQVSLADQSDPARRHRSKIHDHETARSAGLRAPMISGPTLFHTVQSAIFECYGHTYYDGGSYHIRFLHPEADGEFVRVVWRDCDPARHESRRILFDLESKQGTIAATGWVARFSNGEGASAAWSEVGHPVPPIEADPLPEFPLFFKQEYEVCLPIEISSRRQTGYGETNPWFLEESPYGKSLVPPCELFFLCGAQVPPADASRSRPWRLRAPIFAEEHAVIGGPLCHDTAYSISSQVCEKGVSRTSAYFVTEYVLSQQGRQVAVLRHKTRHLLRILAEKEH